MNGYRADGFVIPFNYQSGDVEWSSSGKIFVVGTRYCADGDGNKLEFKVFSKETKWEFVAFKNQREQKRRISVLNAKKHSQKDFMVDIERIFANTSRVAEVESLFLTRGDVHILSI